MKRLNRYYAIITIIAFSLVYLFVYWERFNIIYHLNHFSRHLPAQLDASMFFSILTFGGYSLGSFTLGSLVDRIGGKISIIIGASSTIVFTFLTSISSFWMQTALLCFLNSYIQSIIWIGCIQMISQYFSDGNYSIGIGIANFSSGISHSSLYVLLLITGFSVTWKDEFIFPALSQIPFFILFVFTSCFFQNKPPISPVPKNLPEHPSFLKNKTFRQWCVIAFLSSICRYGLLTWIPLYFAEDVQKQVTASGLYPFIFTIGMSIGTLILTICTEKFFPKNLALPVIAISALCAMLVVVFPMMTDGFSILTGIFFTGFFLYAVNGIIWLAAVYIGLQNSSGKAAGFFNGFAYLGTFFEEVLSPVISAHLKNGIFIFVFMELLCILMMYYAISICKKDTILL